MCSNSGRWRISARAARHARGMTAPEGTLGLQRTTTRQREPSSAASRAPGCREWPSSTRVGSGTGVARQSRTASKRPALHGVGTSTSSPAMQTARRAWYVASSAPRQTRISSGLYSTPLLARRSSRMASCSSASQSRQASCAKAPTAAATTAGGEASVPTLRTELTLTPSSCIFLLSACTFAILGSMILPTRALSVPWPAEGFFAASSVARCLSSFSTPSMPRLYAMSCSSALGLNRKRP
mmetsp:Transcript_46652/g.137842  ORF Transcript_46652/g.137842 Transcript_46652/m.137842 type:complete len:240 (+) Transcript_46652:699-1418(+)